MENVGILVIYKSPNQIPSTLPLLLFLALKPPDKLKLKPPVVG